MVFIGHAVIGNIRGEEPSLLLEVITKMASTRD